MPRSELSSDGGTRTCSTSEANRIGTFFVSSVKILESTVTPLAMRLHHTWWWWWSWSWWNMRQSDTKLPGTWMWWTNGKQQISLNKPDHFKIPGAECICAPPPLPRRFASWQSPQIFARKVHGRRQEDATKHPPPPQPLKRKEIEIEKERERERKRKYAKFQYESLKLLSSVTLVRQRRTGATRKITLESSNMNCKHIHLCGCSRTQTKGNQSSHVHKVMIKLTGTSIVPRPGRFTDGTHCIGVLLLGIELRLLGRPARSLVTTGTKTLFAHHFRYMGVKLGLRQYRKNISRVRFLMRSLDFAINLILPAGLWSWGRLSS
jgi:hypothetical protein